MDARLLVSTACMVLGLVNAIMSYYFAWKKQYDRGAYWMAFAVFMILVAGR